MSRFFAFFCIFAVLVIIAAMCWQAFIAQRMWGKLYWGIVTTLSLIVFYLCRHAFTPGLQDRNKRL